MGASKAATKDSEKQERKDAEMSPSDLSNIRKGKGGFSPSLGQSSGSSKMLAMVVFKAVWP